MKKITIITLLLGNLNMLFCQETTSIKDFLVSESLARKVETLVQFIDNSETIKYNDYDDEPLFIIAEPFNVDIIKKNDSREAITKALININIDNGNNILPNAFDRDDCYAFKISEKKNLVIFLEEKDKKYFIKEKYFNNKCKNVIDKKSKSKITMPKNIFNFMIDEYGITYLYDIGTYDALEYLRWEFLNK